VVDICRGEKGDKKEEGISSLSLSSPAGPLMHKKPAPLPPKRSALEKEEDEFLLLERVAQKTRCKGKCERKKKFIRSVENPHKETLKRHFGVSNIVEI
jgi:hypothetical protein